MNAIFYFDEVLLQYEQQERWDECLEYINKIIKTQHMNKSALLRLAVTCWYVLTFWDCDMPKDRLDRDLFEVGLEKAYVLAKERWWGDADCLWLFGYFMCINQMDFKYISSDWHEVEKVGNDLIRKAYTSDPKNQLAELLYLSDNDKNQFFKTQRKYKHNMHIYFPWESVIEQYFVDIFTGGQ